MASLEDWNLDGVGFAEAHPFLLVVLACALDRLVGDPRWSPHPVVLMGWWIDQLRRLAEAAAGDCVWKLRLWGGWITLVLVGGSGLAGWGIERMALLATGTGVLAQVGGMLGPMVLLLALASALAGRSLEQAVEDVVAVLPASNEVVEDAGLLPARRQLACIVGRETSELNRQEILRALAETASENAVDGLFAPLFWMLVGAGLWAAGLTAGPGPLALAWAFKASSTLDSMLGYRRGRLRWLGTAAARLDDGLVWLPCRITAATLALVSRQPWRAPLVLVAALRDGRDDPSPNAGVSQAAYAHLLGIRLGGLNRYAGELRQKPILGMGNPAPDLAMVNRLLALNARLTWLWLACVGLGTRLGCFITKAVS